MSAKLRRRNFFQLLMVSPLLAISSAGAARKAIAASPDEGIGGTGQSVNGETDHGIGGTGAFGTIQRFGSIFVNDHHITYAPDVPVDIDGARARADALRLGQVVRVVLNGSFDKPSARAIHVTSEVIGPIERIGSREISVLSQTIEFAPRLYKTKIELGKVVAVHGIRKPNGTIVATRIESRVSKSEFVLRGVARDQKGRLQIGNLLIDVPVASLADRRVVVDFERSASGLAVKRLGLEDLVPGLQHGLVSVETYGEKAGEAIIAGVGVQLQPSAFRETSISGHGYTDMYLGAGRLIAPQTGGNLAPPNEKPGDSHGPPNDQNSHEPPAFGKTGGGPPGGGPPGGGK
jgi:hypothetical protein